MTTSIAMALATVFAICILILISPKLPRCPFCGIRTGIKRYPLPNNIIIRVCESCYKELMK